MALAAVGISGCSPDDGKNGAIGPTGPTGPGGGPGPTGPTNPPSIEAGGPVEIGDGSTLTSAQIEAIGTIVATMDSASISATDPVPVITFTLKTSHGGAVTGLAPGALLATVAKLAPPPAGSRAPQSWRSYINGVQTASVGPQPLPSAIQATSESGAAGTLEEIDDGQYRYTYAVNLSTVTTPIAVAFDPGLTHRLGFEIRLSGDAEALSPDNPFADLAPDGSAGNGNKLIAATTNCDACHERLDLHGGPRHTVEYCVTCHNPGTVDPDGGESVDMAYMVHSIHTGVERKDYSAGFPFPPLPYIVYGFGGREHDYGEVTYPQSLLYCENCHAESASSPDGAAWAENASASSCGGCHAYGLDKTAYSDTTGQYTYTYTHSSFPFTAEDGTCTDCHSESGAAGSTADHHLNLVRADGSVGEPLAQALGEQFEFEILAVTNVGLGLVPNVQFRVSKPDGTPYDIVTDPAFTTSGASLNINIAWDAATDITNALPDGTEPGLRSGTTPRQSGYTLQMRTAEVLAAAQAAGQATDGSYTIPFFTAIPVATTNLMVQMEGRPRALPPGKTDWATQSVNAPASMTVFYTGTPRATLVSEARCDNCHAYLQGFHGTNRNGDPQGCVLCHNSSGGYEEEGLGPIAMGAMIHNIHVGNLLVPDSLAEEAGGITYPQSLANCEACHEPGSYYTARPSAVAISTASGVDLFNATDDTWETATSGTCAACHGDDTAKAHMTQNGGLFDVVGGKSVTTPSAASESCAVCHGEGRAVDTAKAHGQ
jgi:OmcA/MtrC family decaheme c-type cytochrome